MHYVFSDLHGCYDQYRQMLDKLALSPDDTLYFLGDAMDRGPDGFKILFDMMEQPNIVPILGNHEDMFYKSASRYGKQLPALERAEERRSFRNWTERNGGDITWAAFCALPEPARQRALAYVERFRLYEELTVAGRRFLLAHAGVGDFEENKDLSCCTRHDFIWTRMDYDRAYYTDRLLITGHTPTLFIDPACRGRMFKRNNHIVVDCGAVYTGVLGALCLETLEEYYVS